MLNELLCITRMHYTLQGYHRSTQRISEPNDHAAWLSLQRSSINASINYSCKLCSKQARVQDVAAESKDAH
jgi:hypothetical protein